VKHKGWFNQPWLPQLQFKATVCSGIHWKYMGSFRGLAKFYGLPLISRENTQVRSMF